MRDQEVFKHWEKGHQLWVLGGDQVGRNVRESEERCCRMEWTYLYVRVELVGYPSDRNKRDLAIKNDQLRIIKINHKGDEI